jgi:hypothetical protein
MDGSELAVGIHVDSLSVACGSQRDPGIEGGGAGHDLEVAAAATALQGAADIAAGFGPVAGYRSALVDDTGLQRELVGIAGAGEGHIHVGSADPIGRAATDALARTIIQRDGPAAGPVAGQAGKRAGLGVARRGCEGRQKKRHKKRDGCKCQPPRMGEEFRCSDWFTGGTLPTDRYKVHLLMPHSISPIRSCH